MAVVHFLGYCSGMAAESPGCCMGPVMLQGVFMEAPFSFPTEWQAMFYPREAASGLAALGPVAEISERLADHTAQLAALDKAFVVLGGDHTSAIGTWSGAAHAKRDAGDIGLIWIDAHMDSHTPATTVSHNIHGMPLAVLLGHGETSLTHLSDDQPKLLPRNVCLIGVRSFETGEAQLLQDLGVRVFYMEEVQQRGIQAVLQEAIQSVSAHTTAYGISLDLDAIAPEDAPGTGIKEPNGIGGQALCDSFQHLLSDDPRLIGLEISEYDPSLDVAQRTALLTKDLIEAVYARRKA